MAYAKESSRTAQTYRPLFTAAGLASFLEDESLGEKFNAPVLTLSNFLNYLSDPSEPITASLINRFYNRALLFSEWQNNFDQLHIATSIAVKNFCDATGFRFSFADVIEPSQVQIVSLNQKNIRERVIEKFLEFELSSLDQYRLFDDRNGKTIAILRLQNGSLRVIAFPNVGALIDGEVMPLTTDFALSYSAKLEFETKLAQNIQLNSTTQARFTVSSGFEDLPQDQRPTLNGAIVRGLTFEPIKIMNQSSIIKEAELFYPLKHLEQFFVNRNTDIVYLELVSSLSRAIDMVLSREPEAVAFAHAVLERSRLAFDQIFPDDKPLQVQVQSLERALSVENVWPQNKISQSPQTELD